MLLLLKSTVNGFTPTIGFAVMLALMLTTETFIDCVLVPQILEYETLTVPPFVVSTEPVFTVFDQE